MPSASGSWSYVAVALTTIVVPLVAAAYALYLLCTVGVAMFDVALLTGLYVVTILGVELGFHRFLTHRALQLARGWKTLFLVAGCMACDGPPIWWAAIHRRHHQWSDHEGDPHSPNLHGPGWRAALRGWWHAHVHWMFCPACTAAQTSVYAPDLLRDPIVQRIDRWYVLWVLLGLALPAAAGGLWTGTLYGAWTALIWGGFVRVFLGQHALWWGIVTVCHTIGTQPFESHDRSRNNVLVAILFLGDGWHNNHHAFPSSAQVGLRWWEIDPTWWAIRALQAMGAAWDIKVPTPSMVESKLKKPA